MQEKKEYDRVCREEENMLDIRFVRENPDVVKQNIKNKFQDAKLPMVD